MRQRWIGGIVCHPQYGVGKVIGYDGTFYDIYFYKANETFIFDKSRHIYWAWPHEVGHVLINKNTLGRIIKRRQQCK